MNNTTEVRGALRDLLDHLGSRSWLVALVWAALALGIFINQIMNRSLVYRAVDWWVVSTLFTYAAGFVMGRLYVPRSMT